MNLFLGSPRTPICAIDHMVTPTQIICAVIDTTTVNMINLVIAVYIALMAPLFSDQTMNSEVLTFTVMGDFNTEIPSLITALCKTERIFMLKAYEVALVDRLYKIPSKFRTYWYIRLYKITIEIVEQSIHHQVSTGAEQYAGKGNCIWAQNESSARSARRMRGQRCSLGRRRTVIRWRRLRRLIHGNGSKKAFNYFATVDQTGQSRDGVALATKHRLVPLRTM